MPRTTKLIIAEGFQVLDIGHRRNAEDIGHRRDIEDIGHRRQLDAELPPDIGHLRAVLELNEPQIVRRVTVHRGADGHIHLELHE